MKYILLISKRRKECELARRLLEEQGYKYREVDSMTSEGKEFMKKYNINSMPSIIDEESKVTFSIGDFGRNMEMVNKEY